MANPVPDRANHPRRSFRARPVEVATEPIQKGYLVEHLKNSDEGGFYKAKSANEAIDLHIKNSKNKKKKSSHKPEYEADQEYSDYDHGSQYINEHGDWY